MMNGRDEFRFGRLERPCLMGVVNVTPNSFSDGGKYLGAEEAVGHGRALMAAGAGMLDVGAEASSFFRTGVEAVGAEEQVARLRGVVPELVGMGAVVSVDTRLAAVARAAVQWGAAVVNDISAGTFDAGMLEAVAESGAGVILMHIGERYPAVVTEDAGDIVAEVGAYLEKRVEAAVRAGIAREKIAVDPGVGFGKSAGDNWRLALGCGVFKRMGVAVVLGGSRKRFLETRPPEDVGVTEWEEQVGKIVGEGHARDGATAVLTRLAWERGVGIHRVHDVTLVRRGLRM